MSDRLRHRRLERHCAAALRALAAQPQAEYRQQRLLVGGRAVQLYTPHLVADAAKHALSRVRAVTDGMALRLALGDLDAHRARLPRTLIARIVFDSLEQLRLEALAPPVLKGVTRNLQSGFDQWCQACRADGVTESEWGLLLYSVIQIARARLGNAQLDQAVEEVIESTRFRLAPLLGGDLAALYPSRHDPPRFARHALNIAHTISEIAAAVNREVESDTVRARIRLPLPPFDAQDAPEVDADQARAVGTEPDALEAYRVFTRQYDRQVSAEDLYRLAQRESLRRRLDALIKAQGISVARLAARLQRLFSTTRVAGWHFAQDQGYLDGRRLSQLVANPANRYVFKQEKSTPQGNSIVSFLLDNSGSMKRQRFESVAVLVDVYARALELAGVTTEILGFSTDGWSGGRSVQAWRRAGSPPQPGRLNDRLHIVYKDAATSWRRARLNVAALLNTVHYREGLDGEAVQWACARLARRNEARKCLVMISDGAPMDSATSHYNSAAYLQQHLQRVVRQVERRGAIQIRALGVELDMETFFQQAVTLDLSGTLSHRAWRALEWLFSPRAPYALPGIA